MTAPKVTSVRIPPNLRLKLDALSKYIFEKTGRSIPRSQIIMEAIYYYLDYLIKQEREDLILKKIIRGREPSKINPRIYVEAARKRDRRLRAQRAKNKKKKEKKIDIPIEINSNIHYEE